MGRVRVLVCLGRQERDLQVCILSMNRVAIAILYAWENKFVRRISIYLKS